MKRTRSPHITASMAAHARYLVDTGKLYQHQVAALLGINQGRVSEIMRGKRHPGIAPARGPFPV